MADKHINAFYFALRTKPRKFRNHDGQRNMALLFCLCKSGHSPVYAYAEWRECVVFAFIIVAEVFLGTCP